jgi:hypothetical protein
MPVQSEIKNPILEAFGIQQRRNYNVGVQNHPDHLTVRSVLCLFSLRTSAMTLSMSRIVSLSRPWRLALA